MYIEITGTGGTNTNLIVPNKKKLYFIYNNTSSGQVTVKVSGQTGVSVANSKKVILVCNGTDVVSATSYTPSPTSGTVTSVDVSGGTTGLTTSGGPVTGAGTVTLAGTLATSNGGTGQTSAQAAINALAGGVTSGQYLRGNGTNVTLSAIQAADVPTLNQNTTGTAGNVSGVVAVGNGGTGATTLTGYVKGSGTSALTASSTIPGSDISGNISGNAAGLSATLVVGSGGTGATTASGARTNILPTYATNAGKVLAVNALTTDVEWVAAGGVGTVTSVDASGGTTGLTFTGGPIIGAGVLTMGGTLGVGAGGTGATTLTGYVKGSGTSALTASSTIPGSDISGNISGNAAGLSSTLAVGSGGTGATTLTGYVKGTGTSALTASSTIPGSDISGNISGNAAGLSSTLAVGSGGTGATTAANARVNLLPSYTSNASKVLALNSSATDVEWVTASAGGGVTSFSGGSTGLTPSTATTGIVTLGGTLGLGYGGTGATTASGARTALDVPSTTGSGASGTWSISINGNAATATNGVVTTGSYSNPAWITALAGSKISGDISGNAANVSGTVAIANGGTGQTTAANAINALLPSQTSQSGKFLTTNGSVASWGTAGGSGTVTSVVGTGTVNGITLTGTVTSSGNLTLGGTLSGVSLTTQVSGTLPVANGGTGVTTSTGSGSVVLSTSPSLTTPVLGTPTSGNLSNCTADGTNAVGYRNVPQSGTSKTAPYTLATSDVGKFIQVGSGGSITIPNSTFAAGDVVSVFNNTSGNITVTCSTSNCYIAGIDTNKTSVTLATRGVVTILFVTSTLSVLTGNVS
jgi:hypothetical protein